MSFDLNNIDFIENDGSDCPVCGAKGGNCAGEESGFHQVRFLSSLPSEDPLATFSVPERIYEEVQQGSRVVRRLKYSKGARIRPAEAKTLGLLP